MSKIQSFAVFVCILWVANAWGAAFMDDFDRPDGAVGNGWSTQTNGTITVEIVDNEVLIAGTQATDWVRCGIYRDVVAEMRVSCDFKVGDNFNFHIRIDDADTSAYIDVYTWGGPMIHANSLDGGWPGWTDIVGSNIISGEYNNVVLELTDGEIIITLNDTVIATLTNANLTSIGRVLIASDAAAGTTGSLRIDNVQIGVVVAGTAKDPSPVQDATDVPQDVVMSWALGAFAATHDVYFGTAFADVNDASRTNQLGVLASFGQTATTYDPEGLLEFDQTYYWRVDEVNAPPDSTIFKGDVWSFTVEPFLYPIQNVTATASSSQLDIWGPQNTVNGSGLDAAGLHSTGDTQMWLSNMTGPQPTWIQYAFDKTYRIYEMWVWNYNTLFESIVGFGIKNATIEYSVDGTNWTTLGTTHEFAPGPGAPGYAHNTTIDFGSVEARYVRLTANSNWGVGGMKQYGLGEVRFLYMPVKAREPVPAAGSRDVPLGVVLDWRGGRKAALHKVYFSSDRQAVISGTAPVSTVTESRYQPGPLEYGRNYYWRVNEVNEPDIWEGDLWSFSTTEYFVVDDFEAYNDDTNRIFDVWADYAVNNTGATVGNFDPPFAERRIFNSGSQSMPYRYDNDGTVNEGTAYEKTGTKLYSEAERTWDSPQDWTLNGADTLTLYFRGNPVTFAEAAAGSITMSAAGADIWGNSDEFRYAYKQLNGDGQIVAKVVSIGGPGTNEWRKAGVMIRESLDGGSRHAFMAITPAVAHGVAFQNRPTSGGGSVNASQNVGITTPCWVKLVRQGAQFTGYYSTNGTNWVQVPASTASDGSPNPQTITMSPNAYIGLALTSHESGVSCVAQFSDVTITGATGAWKIADIGVAQPGNDAQPMYVVLQDSANKTAIVKHPDAAATLLGTWTEWSIPMADFTGVNPKAIKKLSIGVGDRTNPQRGGSGRLYIDDIQVGRPGRVVVENLLANGGFEDGVLAPWTIWSSWGDVTGEVVQQLVGAAVPEAPVEGDFCVHLVVPTPPGVAYWECCLQHGRHVFEKGKKYTHSAFFKCKKGTMQIGFELQIGQDPWTVYSEQSFTITEEWAEYSLTSPVFNEDVSPGNVLFRLAFEVGDFWVDGVRFYEGDYVPPPAQ